MENKTKVSVVIDGKVYMLSGTGSESYMQRIASYVDGKIRELKQQSGYAKLSPEYRSILLSLNIAEETFKLQDELNIFHQEHQEKEQELYKLKQEIVDKEMRIDTANKLVIEYKTKVNELQKRIIELETRSDLHETNRKETK
ncbi:MAG TPA: cell division protein ZapA [Candidatus Anaerobutyricum stercoripullorum]|uniref:Cell division protein ZapA n=1 Tax=Candidatus Anaerobutyricum stercoripullorum TaxID=2838456 RepID=A0A9D1X4B1_9FIRM|nr:cell division protein ZapA [Candidatus Anaerobutyricum stercoripullorum]